jgi:2-aminoadipate transaminase
MPPGVTWTRPEGGLFVWATLPSTIDADVMLTSAVEAGVAYVPGGAFYVEDVKPNTMRLTFASAGEAQINDGIVRLAAVVGAALR